ncbi:MAG: NUDIX domain-containing protein [Nanoarchaeota archaeon]
MKLTQCAGGVVLNKKGLILLVSQRGNSWSFPKGHIDEGEEPLTAARREIREESGVTDLKLIKELGSYGRYRGGLDGGDDPSEFKTIHMFLFSTDQEKLQPQDPYNPEARWVDRKKVAELLTFGKDKEFFRNVARQI